MAITLSISTRVSPELRERLIAQARARQVSLGTLTRDLLAAGVDGGAPAPVLGDVRNEVACVFHGLPPEAGVHRAICLALARQVEVGGSGAVPAAKELLELTDWVRRRFEPEDYEDEDEG